MTKQAFRKTPLALAVAAAFQMLPAHSAVPAGNEFQVNTFTSGQQTEAAVALNNSGDYVVVWQSSGQDGGGNGIYAQRYNAAGAAQGSEFRVNATTINTQSFPAVAMDGHGDFVVVWDSADQDGSSYGIYAQRYSAAGAAQGSEFNVNATTASSQRHPTVAMDGDGNFVVAWNGQDGAGIGIYAQRYNAAGAAQDGEFQVNTYTTSIQRSPAVTMDAAGDFVVSWQSFEQVGGSYYDIYARRYNAAGAAQGGEFKVNSYTTNSQTSPTVKMDATGNFVVSWQSYDQDASYDGIYAQRYNAAGAAQGSEFRVNTYVTGAQASSAVAMDASGDFVVSWQSNGQDGSNGGIYAQRYNAAGVAKGSEAKINTTVLNTQSLPAVAMDAAGDFVVAWSSYNQDASNDGIYAQRYVTENLTSMLSATAGGQSYNSTPSFPDFLAGGTFSFNANYCNNSANILSGLYSQVTVLANNNQQGNRTRNSANGDGGAGAQLEIAATNGYSDLLLGNAECVSVPYVIGLTARAPFQFKVNIKGDSGN